MSAEPPRLALAPVPTGREIDTDAAPEATWERYRELLLCEAREWWDNEGSVPATAEKLRADYARPAPGRHSRCFLLTAPKEATPDNLVVSPPGAAEFAQPGQILGYVGVYYSSDDNLGRAWLGIYVLPAWRFRGIGSAAINHARRLVADLGRRDIEAWAIAHPAAPDDPDPVLPATGVGAVSLEGPTSLLLARGFRLAQVEYQLRLPAPRDRQGRLLAQLAALREEGAAGAREDYELESWQGMPGDPAAVADMFRRFSADIPASEGLEPSAWDEEKVVNYVERLAARGVDLLWTAVRHRDSGQLVGYTMLEWPHGADSATQEDTWVSPEHRGHRLGLLIKATNTARAIGGEIVGRPGELRTILTWLAAENEHMLAINRRLGFTIDRVEGCWILDV
ncbi:MAG: GNAT family N-acetyltransferase [Flaviflexus sp.]|nr:GNAT family N-acetyltransferase [Flaviflexus sp.]